MQFVRGLIIASFVFILTEPRVIAGGSGCNGYPQTIDLSSTQNGSIYSPGYPNNYGDNENCQWLIQAPSYGDKVLIYFTTFDLEDDGNQCSYDYVEIRNGRYSNSPLLSKSCGSSLPSPVYSSSRYLYLKFKSDSSVSRQGFVAHYRALNSSSGCPLIVPGDSAGVMYSPNFPSYYPNRQWCYWNITAPWPKKINLKFIKFDVGPSYGYCGNDYVEVQTEPYGSWIKYCGSRNPSSLTSFGSIRVRFYSDWYSSYQSGFLAFYQTGYSFPTQPPTTPYWTPYTSWTRAPYTYWTPYPYWTTYPPTYSPSPASIYSCNRYYQTNIFIPSSSSSYIASSTDIDGYYPTSLPRTTCTFKISTTKGYSLELSFTKMTISSCTGCSCGGYVKVRDGSSSTARLLGTYCSDNYRDVVVKAKGNYMFVEYYARRRGDTFKATVRSTKGKSVNVPAIVVPIVVAVVLFSIIFVVIKCTKISRSAGPAGSYSGNEVSLQIFPGAVELPPTTQSLSSNTEFSTGFPAQPLPPNTGFTSPSTSQPLAPNTELTAPPCSEPVAQPSDLLPFSTGYSQGVTNISLGDGTAQL